MAKIQIRWSRRVRRAVDRIIPFTFPVVLAVTGASLLIDKWPQIQPLLTSTNIAIVTGALAVISFLIAYLGVFRGRQSSA
jgi:hypothetical protein